MRKIKPKKYLGQHFLKDEDIAKKIVNSIQFKTHTTEKINCIEIGPGTGVLTKYLIENEKLNTYVIELDNESIEYLIEKKIIEKKKIFNENILKINLLDKLDSFPIVIGNFPYNISSQIFFKILEFRNEIKEVVCMIQKEVAERIASPPGNKAYGILSVYLQTFFEIEYLFTVHENVFIPPPKVKSAVIRLKRNNTININCNIDDYFRVIKTTFNQRRKTIRNSLKPISKEKTIDSEFLSMRPEQLSVNDFIQLTNEVYKK